MKNAAKWGIVVASALGALYSWYCVVPSFYHKWVSRKAIRKIPHPADKEIVLTFDDGPDPRYTPKVLDVLKRYGVPAHFFVVAERAKENPDLVRRMLEEGHEVGLHSRAHRNAWLVAPAYVKRDFAKSAAILRELGVNCKYYRPPWGYVNQETLKQIQAAGYQLVMWNVMAQDWKRNQTSREIVRRLLERVQRGSIICLHDGGGAPGAPERTIDALESALPVFQKIGYRFVLLKETGI